MILFIYCKYRINHFCLPLLFICLNLRFVHWRIRKWVDVSIAYSVEKKTVFLSCTYRVCWLKTCLRKSSTRHFFHYCYILPNLYGNKINFRGCVCVCVVRVTFKISVLKYNKWWNCICEGRTTKTILKTVNFHVSTFSQIFLREIRFSRENFW